MTRRRRRTRNEIKSSGSSLSEAKKSKNDETEGVKASSRFKPNRKSNEVTLSKNENNRFAQRKKKKNVGKIDKDIIEQLKRQRAKKQAEHCQSHPVKTKTGSLDLPPTTLGKYQYDPIRKAYFPVTKNQNKIQKNQQESRDAKKMNLGHYENNIIHFRDLLKPILSCPNNMNMSSIASINLLPMCFSVQKRKQIRSLAIGKVIASEGQIEKTLRKANDMPFDTCSARNEFISHCKFGITHARSNYSANRNDSDNNSYSDQCNESRDHQGDNVVVSTKQQWVSMLSPIILPYFLYSRHGRSESNAEFGLDKSTLPLDCICKRYLHPSMSTFSVLPPSDHNYFPSFLTVLIKGLYFRPSKLPSQPYLIENKRNNISHESIDGEATGKFIDDYVNFETHRVQTVKFAQLIKPDDMNRRDSCSFGFITYDPHDELSQNFIYGRMRTFHRDRRDLRFIHHTLSLPGGVNDFSFPSYSALTSTLPSKIAFASKSTRPYSSTPLFLDVETSEFSSIQPSNVRNRQNLHLVSDMMCVEYLRHDDLNTLLYGHRNGSISIYDERSGWISLISNKWADKPNSPVFGSVSSLRVLDVETGGGQSNPNLILARGAFGACHLFDLRKLGKSINMMSSCLSYDKSQSPALLWQMKVPNTSINPMDTTRCSGLALDPTGNFCISPFVNEIKTPCLGFWCLSTGRFLKNMRLSSVVEDGNLKPERFSENRRVQVPWKGYQESESDAHTGHEIPYCELSRTITPAYEYIYQSDKSLKNVTTQYFESEEQLRDMFCVKKKNGSWGLWFKYGSIIDSNIPAHAGGVRHISFPGY